MNSINDLWKKTPIEVRVMDSSSYQEFTNDQKTELIVNSYLNEFYKDLSSNEIETTLSDAKKLQDKIIVNVKIIKGELKFPEETKPFSIIKKTFSTEEDIEKIVLFESIPENIAKTDLISFNEQPFYRPEYVFWNLDGIHGQEIIYTTYSDTNMADLKGVKSVAFIETPLIKPTSDSLTGQVIGLETTKKNSGGFLLILIVAGVLVVCGLFAYYIFWSETESTTTKIKNQDEKKPFDQNHAETKDNAKTQEVHSATFNLKNSLFKKKKESILPEDSHRKINIEKPDESIHTQMDNVEFTKLQRINESIDLEDNSFEHHYNSELTTDELQEIEQQKEPFQQQKINRQNTQFNTPSNIQRTTQSNTQKRIDIKLNTQNTNKFNELQILQDTLRTLRNNSKVDDLDDFDELRSQTYEIKKLCEEIEEESIIDFANKTKAHLEKSLLYIAKNVPLTKKATIENKQPILENNQTIKNVENKSETQKFDETQTNITSNYNNKINSNNQLAFNKHENSETQITLDFQLNKSPKTAPKGYEFVLSTGEQINTIPELKSKLIELDSNLFKEHVNDSKNDFANWIRDVFKEYELAHIVRGLKTKDEIINVL